MTDSRTARGQATALMLRLQLASDAQFEQLREAPSQREALQQPLLLGLELRWKLEEQLLYPALARADRGASGAVLSATREIDCLRDLAEVADRVDDERSHALVLAALEGLASLHAQSLTRLLETHGAHPHVEWSAVAREMQQWLERWQSELETTGEIEDEERDPVGLPPR